MKLSIRGDTLQGEQLKEDNNSSVNPNYTFVDGNGSLSIPSGRTFSWRYHTDNSWDIFDEDIEDVVITGDNPITSDGEYCISYCCHTSK